MRIVSVLPSATEIVVALGHERDLVGRSAECDHPASIRDRPVVMRPRTDDFTRSSAEIDARVREVRARAESLYVLDIELLRELQPDLLLTQDLCGVCSVTEAEAAAACAVAGIAPRVVSLAPRTLPEVWESIDQVAQGLEDLPAGRRLRMELERRTARPPSTRPAPSVAVVEWLDPPILAGLWTPDIVAAAGGRSLGPSRGGPGVRTSWEETANLAPDLLVLSPCSFSVDRARQEIARGGLSAPLSRVKAPLGTYLADEAYFSRPGPRLAEGVRLIRRLIQGRDPEGEMPAVRWAPPAGGIA